MNRRRCTERHPETKGRCELKAPHGPECRIWRSGTEIRWTRALPELLGAVLTPEGFEVIRRSDPDPLGRMFRAMNRTFGTLFRPPKKEE